jgi:hypothetical protein
MLPRESRIGFLSTPRFVKHYVKVGGKNGRLWFYLCNIELGTPLKNIKAAVGAVHKYGTYKD